MLLGCCHCGQAQVSEVSYSFSIASEAAQACLTNIGFTVVPKKYRITSYPTNGSCSCDIHYHINGNGPDPTYSGCDSGGWITPPYTPPPQMNWVVGGSRPNLCGPLNVQHGGTVTWSRVGASSWNLIVGYSVSGGFSHQFIKNFTSLPDPLAVHTVPFNSFGYGDATYCGAPADCTVGPI